MIALVAFTEPNGTYSYIVGNVSGYSVSPSSGSITVSGKNLNQSITFTPTITHVSKYTVTFTESGLPSGTTWYVNLSNGLHSGPITGSSYTFQLTNGTYSYTIATSDHTYEPSPSSGSLTVNGAPISESVTFSKVLYKVTFTESGLSPGTLWSVTLNGTSESSTSGTITFTEPNGTYSYTVSSVSGYTLSPSSGSIPVHGSNTAQSITFTHNTSKKAPFKLSPIELYAIIGAVVAIAAIGGAFMVIRRRK